MYIYVQKRYSQPISFAYRSVANLSAHRSIAQPIDYT